VAVRQCLRCGGNLGCIPKRNVLLSGLAEWDDTLGEAWAKRAQQQLDADRAQKAGEWWSWYNEYLLSEEWQSLRIRVFARARGVCEGCGINSATQVHHLTYVRVGQEMLFDLVAVCDDCHSRIHPEDRDVIHE